MSLIGKDNINYLTQVEQFFLSLKGSGLSLSASDYQLITEWEERRISVTVLCRAIESAWQKGKQQSREPHPRLSLTQLQDEVEQEINKAAQQ